MLFKPGRLRDRRSLLLGIKPALSRSKTHPNRWAASWPTSWDGYWTGLGPFPFPKTTISGSETGCFRKAYYRTHRFILCSRSSASALAVAFWAVCIRIGRCHRFPWLLFCLLGAIWLASGSRPRSSATYDNFVIGKHYRWSWFYLQGALLAGKSSTSNIA